MQFPAVEGDNLLGTHFTFPADFDGGPTIAIVAFDQASGPHVASWLPFIDGYAANGCARGRLFGILGTSMRLMKTMVDVALRKAAADPAAREATIPLFVDIDAFCAALAITDRRTVSVFVVEPGGEIVARATGAYSDAAGDALRDRLPALA
jgi:hypothetical protein